MMTPLIGLGLFLLGCSYPIVKSSSLEIKFIAALQKQFGSKTVTQFFQEMWHFGRTSFALVVLVLLSCLSWQKGLVALSIFGITVGLERIVKQLFNRQRPFKNNQQIAMLQPLKPLDPSFPSGDALRIWYLALITAAIFSSLPFWIAAAILALVISLGRIMMGVHYLSDVLAGSGLGVFAAGAAIWLWEIFQLIG
ncbi:MAG: phosphatase PAP2 family protein [Anaerolineales bacterium]